MVKQVSMETANRFYMGKIGKLGSNTVIKKTPMGVTEVYLFENCIARNTDIEVLFNFQRENSPYNEVTQTTIDRLKAILNYPISYRLETIRDENGKIVKENGKAVKRKVCRVNGKEVPTSEWVSVSEVC